MKTKDTFRLNMFDMEADEEHDPIARNVSDQVVDTTLNTHPKVLPGLWLGEELVCFTDEFFGWTVMTALLAPRLVGPPVVEGL